MADKTLRGRFVWHELKTPDASSAHTFYNRVLGWKTQAWEQDPSYKMFAGGGGLVGATAASDGAPAWIHYIGTPDLDATLVQATALGGIVGKEATDIPGGARYAVLTDPQGATFAIYSSPEDQQPERDPRHQEFSWMELATTDAKSALDFYCELFGWERNAVYDMGALGFYYLFSRNGRQLGGVFDKPAAMPGPAAWLGYVRQKDLDKVVGNVKDAGGSLIHGPMEVPGGDWIAQFLDPHGAMFAVHVVQNDVKSAGHVPSRQLEAVQESGKKSSPKKRAVAKSTKKRSAAVKKRARVKTAKRSVRKAVRVGSRSVKVKGKAVGAKKSGTKARKSSARPRKSK